MLVNGYEGCLEVQALKKWNEDIDIQLCNGAEELTKGVAYGAQAVVPSYNSVYGHNWSLYKMLINFDYKIIDELDLEPEFYVAAKSDRFEIVTAPENMLSITGEHWRKHRSYLLQPSETTVAALKRSQQFEQYATICTLEEAKNHNLPYCYKVKHPQFKQRFAIVNASLSKDEYESFVVLVKLGEYKVDSLNLLTYAFADHDVLIEDIFMLDQQNLVLRVLDDYKRARVRRIFNQLKDLGMSSVKVLGGKLVTD